MILLNVVYVVLKPRALACGAKVSVCVSTRIIMVVPQMSERDEII